VNHSRVNHRLKPVEDPRLAEMLDVIFKFAAGDLTARGRVSDDDSSLDGVMAGINILGEELEAYVAETKQAEDALRASEKSYRLLFESSRDALMTLAPPSWRFTSANRATLDLFGAASTAAFTELGPWNVSPERQPDGRPSGEKAQEMIAAAMREGKNFFEWEHQRLDGHPFPADVLLTRVDLGSEVFLQATVRDVTERKNQERALWESDERFKSILENVVEMFFIADGSLQPEYLSPRCLDIYGYSSDEMIARPTLGMESIYPEDRAAVAKHAAEVMRSGARSVREYRILRKDGSVRWVRSASNPILGADGKLQRVYGTIMDITEFESLRSSLTEKEVLLKEIHHRVKNNLQIVISLMRLESRAFSEERVRAALKDLETRIRAMALVHEHLYHSSDLAKIGFKDYLKGLCEELFRTYRADGGRIRLEIDAEAIALDIERAIPCGLVINELLTNAIKYAFPRNRKGTLRVAIRNASNKEIEIVVGDDGIGIPETLDIRTAKTLGLQLVTTLAENQLKGRVELERAGGTRFTIRFGL